MPRPGLLIILALITCGAACAQAPIVASVKEELLPQKDAGREGLVIVKRSLTLGNAAFRYQQLVDPAQRNKPVAQRYGDYFLGCDFPRGTWNWDLQYFLDVTVTRPNEKPFIANRAALQEGIYVLQQGQRGVADMVWPLPAGQAATAGRLAVHFIRTPEDPAWMTIRVSLEDAPEAAITRLALNSYPTVTSGPAERQRWATTPTRALQMASQAVPLNVADEWALVLHNRHAHEERGCLIVMDPYQLESGEIGGTYAVSPRFNTRPLQAVSFTIGYFWDTRYDKAAATFFADAPQRLQRLRATDWTVPVDLAGWQKRQAEAAEVLALVPETAKEAQQWRQLKAEMDALAATLQAGGATEAACRRFVLLNRQTAALREALYEPALQALIKQATQ